MKTPPTAIIAAVALVVAIAALTTRYTVVAIPSPATPAVKLDRWTGHTWILVDLSWIEADTKPR